MAPKSLTKGDPIRLMKDALPLTKLRDWEFEELIEGKIFLFHPEKKYIVEFKESDIDWEHYQRVKSHSEK